MITRFVQDEAGHIAIEYGMIAALIAILLISAITGIGLEVESMLNNLVPALAAPKP